MDHLLRPLLLLLSLSLALPAAAQWFKQSAPVMGTRIHVEVWADSAEHAQRCIDQVMAEMRRVDALMSPYKEDSELSQINARAAKHPVRVSKELFDLILRSLHFSQLSNGSFDITFASVGHKYNYREHRKPSARDIEQALPAIDYRHLLLNEARHSIAFARQGVQIDLGGIAKGHAVDNGIALLETCGIQRALVTAGGDSRILGDKNGRPWMSGIRDPRKEQGTAIVIPLSDTAISTSGDYERYFIQEGVRYHHIISPQTGRSVETTRSVSIIGPDATTTDALSTTVFVLGPQKGMALVETLSGIDGVIIDSEGRVHYSSGLAPPEPGRQ